MNRLASEGINFTRMYTEPACTPTRVAFLTGRHPVRHGMGVVGMPHEMAGLRGDAVTIAEVLSEAGYVTAHFGKGHLGDIEESYPHNQGFDETLFTPMVTVHGSARAPRPATLPCRSLPLQTHSNRQRCGEGLGEGKPAKLLCPAPRPVNGYYD
jgi:arylsulfatase A-like enzyme